MWGWQSVFKWNQAVLCDIFTFNPDTRRPPSAWPQSTHTVCISQWLSLQLILLAMFWSFLFSQTFPAPLLPNSGGVWYCSTYTETRHSTVIHDFLAGETMKSHPNKLFYDHSLKATTGDWSSFCSSALYLQLPRGRVSLSCSFSDLFTFLNGVLGFVYLKMMAKLAAHKAPALHCISC